MPPHTPLLVEHRVNTLAHLRRVPPSRGVEVDVRDYAGDLRLVHDPLQSGERLSDWLAAYQHALLIFNVKCDGLEDRLIALAAARNVSNFLFLDVANPTLVKLARRGERRVAVRYSEFEPLAFALAFAGQVDWVWIDTFTRLPLDPATHAALAAHFKLCLVSPELQGHPRARIADFRAQLAGLPLDAVCSDFCEDWAGA
ncbi:MAG: hypothetical protein IT317_24400 [Anaerolineales bacterium]|nr:hypothetical protein [Anaerolineales bacterium]